MVKKKNIRKSALLLIMIMLATGITACGTEEEPLPDLSAMGAVTAVSREEGSGTRAEFENLLKLPESDTGIVVDSTEKVLKKGKKIKTQLVMSHIVPQQIRMEKYFKSTEFFLLRKQ